MLKEVFHYFLRLGSTGFGGPLAIVAILQKDLIEERKWMPLDEWQRTFTLIKAMPGPIAFMSSVFLGHRRAGFWGALLAAVGLILPAFIMMLCVGATLGRMPDSIGLHKALTGLQIGGLVAMCVGSQSIFKGYERDRLFWCLAFLAATIGHYLLSWEPLVILGFGGILVGWYRRALWKNQLGSWGLLLLALFWVHFKAGAFVFGSGLAIVPMLQSEVVGAKQWLTNTDFLNALTFGQITPGPVVITATLIGWKVAGFAGALIATISVFLASFIHMSTWFPKVASHLSRQAWMNVFLRGALAAVTGFIAISVLKLFGSVDWTWIMAGIFACAYYLAKYKATPLWLVIPLCGFFNWL